MPSNAKAMLRRRLEHPTRSMIAAVLKLTEAENTGSASQPLSLRESSGLLTHLRNLTRYMRWES